MQERKENDSKIIPAVKKKCVALDTQKQNKSKYMDNWWEDFNWWLHKRYILFNKCYLILEIVITIIKAYRTYKKTEILSWQEHLIFKLFNFIFLSS